MAFVRHSKSARIAPSRRLLSTVTAPEHAGSKRDFSRAADNGANTESASISASEIHLGLVIWDVEKAKPIVWENTLSSRRELDVVIQQHMNDERFNHRHRKGTSWTVTAIKHQIRILTP